METKQNVAKIISATKILIFFILVSIVTTIVACSRRYDQKRSSIDTTNVVEQVKNTLNPTFKSVDEFIVFRQKEIEKSKTDKLFMEVPTSIIAKVATVCINRDGFVTKESAMQEFLNYPNVYKYLEDSTKIEYEAPAFKIQSELSSTKPDSNTITKDTIINGKLFRYIETTKIQNYE